MSYPKASPRGEAFLLPAYENSSTKVIDPTYAYGMLAALSMPTQNKHNKLI